MTSDPTTDPNRRFVAQLVQRRQLSDATFELAFNRPADFSFIAGQRIRIIQDGFDRDYTLISAPADTELTICVRLIPNGKVTPYLIKADLGCPIQFCGPYGYFLYRPSVRPAVFIATGTGIAPYVSFARCGVQGFSLIHGVRHPEELYYQDIFKTAARTYIPCLSSPPAPTGSSGDPFCGRVTDYLSRHWPAGTYDFYLCGRTDMIRDITHIVDDRFSDSHLFSEAFF